jgi:hypothetical protein
MTDTYELPPEAPIVCTIRPGDDEQTMMETYHALFAEEVFVSGERTAWGVRWTFHDKDGVEQRVREQAAFEQRCCAFMRMAITVADGVVVWDVIGPANATLFLDEYVRLPQTAFGSIEVLRDRTLTTGMVFDDRRQAGHDAGNDVPAKA